MIFTLNMKEVEMFLRSQGGGVLFEEYEEDNDLSVRSRGYLGDLLVAFLYDVFGEPQKQQIHHLCEAVLVLFPTLEHQPSIINGIVSGLSICIYIRSAFVDSFEYFSLNLSLFI